jgi:enoyl-CoA hydratase
VCKVPTPGGGAPLGRREAQGGRPSAQRESSTDSSRLFERRERSEFRDAGRQNEHHETAGGQGRSGGYSLGIATLGLAMSYELITIRTEADKVGIVTLNRPKQLNALNDALMDELGQALKAFDADPAIGCMVITGSEKAFAAGADIGAMAGYSFAEVYRGDYITRNWEQIRSIRKPVIAAVSGFALGGGCELAMMCDFIIAADNARFGQPEIKLGIIPGAGGTQRLPRAVGKAKAMDMALTGRMMDAAEAERAGLVSRVVALDKLMDEALGAALQICDYSQLATMAAKESVNRAFEGSLSDGVMFERRLFHALFATADQKEGMDAFVAKRKANFKHA